MHLGRLVVEKESKIFELNSKSSHIKGAISLRDKVIKVVDLDNALNSNDMIIYQTNKYTLAIEVDEVLDIESFEVSKIEYIEKENDFIKGFYNLKKQVVAIIDFKNIINEDDEEKNDNSNIQNSSATKESFLVFVIENKEFCISMEVLRSVNETHSLSKTKSSSIGLSGSMKFLTTWNHQAVNVLSLENLLGVRVANEEESHTIIIESNEKLVGFLVDDIKDIIMIDKKNINLSNKTDVIIKGAVLHNNKALAILNEGILVK